MAYVSMGEAHRRITDFLSRFSDAISSQDGAALRSLLAVSSNSSFLLSLADALNIFQVFCFVSTFCYANFLLDLMFARSHFGSSVGLGSIGEAIGQELAAAWRNRRPSPPLHTELPNWAIR